MRFFSGSIGSSPWSSLKLFDSLAAQRHDPPGPAHSALRLHGDRGSGPQRPLVTRGRGHPARPPAPSSGRAPPALSRAARGAKQRCALGFPANWLQLRIWPGLFKQIKNDANQPQVLDDFTVLRGIQLFGTGWAVNGRIAKHFASAALWRRKMARLC